MTDCLFCKISAGEIPAEVVYENDEILGFRDIEPKAPTHVLLIPRRHIATLNDLAHSDVEVVGKLFLAAKEVARQEGVDAGGYRTVFNCNRDAGQAVYHIHLHLLGGRQLSWPPG